MSTNYMVTTDGHQLTDTTRHAKCVRYRRKSIFEAKQWSFEEMSTLMNIWSRLEMNSYETKQMMYKYIQTKLKRFGYNRSTDQIRCKLRRVNPTTDTVVDESLKPSERSRSVSTNYQQFDDKTESETLSDTNSTSDDESSLTSFSEEEIDYDIKLTESEDSNDSQFMLFNPSFGSEIDFKSDKPKSLVCENSQFLRQQLVINNIEELKSNTQQTFHQIISAQKQLKESITKFNSELSRMTDQILNSNDNHSLNTSSPKSLLKDKSIDEVQRKPIKLLIPNINKNYCIYMNDN
ncbi:uncharacterized protein LOC128961834 [Oppia nitens]|uniref:uncharacterized protein LOC128961834 n=1 Tax=Oppia nitens TaxID=1686743 RepID=UPI0023D9879C|nr:uncharacterized protein LOC128961834 [Oppia nitens]